MAETTTDRPLVTLHVERNSPTWATVYAHHDGGSRVAVLGELCLGVDGWGRCNEPEATNSEPLPSLRNAALDLAWDAGLTARGVDVVIVDTY